MYQLSDKYFIMLVLFYVDLTVGKSVIVNIYTKCDLLVADDDLHFNVCGMACDLQRQFTI